MNIMIIIKRLSKISNSRTYKTMSFLDMDPKEFHKFLGVNKLRNIDENLLQKTANYFLESQYDKNEITAHAGLFKYAFWISDQKITTLKEAGFKHVPLAILLKFRSIMNKKIEELKQLGRIPEQAILVKSLISHLDPPADLNIDDLLDESLSFSHVHRTLLNRYLVFRLGATESQVSSLYRIHHRLSYKPFSYLCWNIEFALSIGYSKDRILNNIYILCTHPRNTREVIQEVPQFLDVDMKKEMLVYPKLIGIPLENLRTIYDNLKRNGIKDEAIKKSMNIFTMSTKTVESRLKEIQTHPELRVLLYDHYVLKLIIHLNRAKDRFAQMQAYKMKCANVTILGAEGRNFEDHVRDGKDVNYNQELYRFIKRLLNCNIGDIKEKLRLHPYFNYVPLSAIQDSYHYLKSLQFTELELQAVVQLLLYPRSKIKSGYTKSKEYIAYKNMENVNKIQLLNLTLYFIEKEHHFTGNGIWDNNEENNLL